MNIFMAILAKHGRIHPAALDDAVAQAERTLPFPGQAVRGEMWLAPSGQSALAVWSNDTGAGAPVHLMRSSQADARTMAGLVIAPGIAQPWNAGDVCEHVSFTDQGIARLNGTFALARVESDPATIHVFNTTTRWMPVYWSETADVIVVSNRAMLVNMVITGGAKPVFDPLAIGNFLPYGIYMSDAVPFWGVQVMPSRSRLIAKPSGVQIRPYEEPLPPMDVTKPTPQVIDRTIELMVESVGWMAQLPVTVGLSGGRDSRMVSAALKLAGVPFATATRGFPDSPEVIIAARVAAALDVPHSHSPGLHYDSAASAFLVDPVARASTAVWQNDAMVSAWENLSTGPFDRSIRAGGEGATSLRAGWARKIWGTPNPTWAQARRVILGPFNHRRNLLTAETISRQEQFVDTWLQRMQPLGVMPTLSYFEIEVRSGRWIGPMVNGRVDQYQVQPLMFEQMVKWALQIELAPKVLHRFCHEIIKRMMPPLAEIPMTGKRGHFEQEGPLPGDEAGWLLRTPLHFIPGTPGAFDWRRLWTTDMYEPFFETIFRNRDNDDLFLSVQREPLERWFISQRNQPAKQMDSSFAWALLSASVMLENRWSDSSPPVRRVIALKPPVDPADANRLIE